PGVSFGKELALAHALTGSSCAPLHAWAAERLSVQAPAPFKPPSPAGKVRLIAPDESQRLHEADERGVALSCMAVMGERTLGLPEALRARAAPSMARAGVVAALFGACDDVSEVAAQIDRFASESLDFLEKLEGLAVQHWAHTPELPLLGAAWLWRWER